MVAAGKISRSGLQVDGASVYWSESRPHEGGREVVVCAKPGLAPVDASPPGVSVRSRVHEYGGGAATVENGALFYVDQDDQRWYRTDVGDASEPIELTPPSPASGPSTRYADGWTTCSGQWLVSVEEGMDAGAVDHRLVAVAVLDPPRVVPLVDDGDFVASPRPSPDGRWLAWVTWDHPSMPWDSSELWVAHIDESAGTIRLEDAQRVAGGDGTSVGQPRWCRDGSLLFVDDRRGWWQPYRLRPEQFGAGRLGAGAPAAKPLVDVDAEFHAPDWVLGQSTMAELADGSIVCRMHKDGRDQLARLHPTDHSEQAKQQDQATQQEWSIDVVDQPCVSISGVVATRAHSGAVGSNDADSPARSRIELERVCVLGSTATEAQGVFEISLDGETPPRRISAAPSVEVSIGDVSVAQPFTASTSSGPVPGLFFSPARAEADGEGRGLPPLVVFCHGGPTAAAPPGFDPVVQFFTSRGLAVAFVDYRGSTGYGRAYRQRLAGLWGEADVDDCVNYAVALDQAGRVDGGRMAIRGTSAGGLTALAALIRSRRFAGAAAWYGVTDLAALAADTHDFESHYVDSLVGPWPEAAETYRARSPINHPDRVSGAVLLLQGADDPVVPPDQSERFAAMLKDHGVQCQLTLFEGESHGFRRATTIEASLTAELDFYRSLFIDRAQTEPPPAAR
jgi:dipeptidyl aminopeptidase/acylaminoacyl peptidase